MLPPVTQRWTFANVILENSLELIFIMYYDIAEQEKDRFYWKREKRLNTFTCQIGPSLAQYYRNT